MEKLNTNELLLARDLGILNTASVREQLEAMEREKYLGMHEHKIFFSGGRWCTYFYDETGVRTQKSLKNKLDLENYIVSFYKEKCENPTIEEIFTEWNSGKLELDDIKSSTFDRNNDFYKRHFSVFGKRRIKDVTPREWGEFWQEQVSTYKLSHKAFYGLKRVSMGILKKAKHKGFISFALTEPMEYTDFGKNSFSESEKEDSDEVFDEVELKILFNYLLKSPDSQNLGILLMLLTGMRVGEIATLKNCYVGDGVVKVRHSETRYKIGEKKYTYEVSTVKTKAGKRDVVLPNGCEWVCDVLRNLNPTGEFVFVNQKGERLTTNSFRRRQERVLKKLGLEHKSCHKCRKTYATILLDANLDANLIIKQMGHTDITITEEKYHRDRKEITTKAKTLGNIREFDVVKKHAM